MHITIPWNTYFSHYGRLSAEERLIYDRIRTGLQDWAGEIHLRSCFDRVQAFRIYLLVLMDIPLFFHIKAGAGFTDRGSITIHPEYTMSQDAYRKAFPVVSGFLQNSCRQLKGRADFDKLRILHDAMVRNVIYHDTESRNEHSVLGALLDRSAVCESIAKSFKALCDINHIPSFVLFGWANSGEEGFAELDEDDEDYNHAWNLVLLDRNWYVIDVTFDINLSENLTNSCRYDYFLRSDRCLADSHRVPDIFSVPECRINYPVYDRIGLLVKNRRDVKAVSSAVLKTGASEIQFELGPDYNASDDQLSDLVLSVSRSYGYNAVRYSTNEKTRVFCARLSR